MTTEGTKQSSNMFDALVVDKSNDTTEAELPMQAFPPIEVLRSIRARPRTKRNAQRPSKADRELSKMVKEIEAAGVKVKLSAAARANLDELDSIESRHLSTNQMPKVDSDNTHRSKWLKSCASQARQKESQLSTGETI